MCVVRHGGELKLQTALWFAEASISSSTQYLRYFCGRSASPACRHHRGQTKCGLPRLCGRICRWPRESVLLSAGCFAERKGGHFLTLQSWSAPAQADTCQHKPQTCWYLPCPELGPRNSAGLVRLRSATFLHAASTYRFGDSAP